ncbi:MAG: DUF1385 domain-containing protein [Armatimonadetes bacterium]|nr:DUF1385 domain-containing protein [Armatimonadota bacterium]
MAQPPSGEDQAAGRQHFYGGQAVIEGVMMRAPERWAVAVRRASGRVSLLVREQPALARRHAWARWPLIRGNVGLYEALALGWNSLQASAQMALEDAPGQPASKPSSRLLVALSGILAAGLGIGLFILLPTWSADWFGGGRGLGPVAANVVEGLVRLAVLISYIALVGLLPDIRRVFQYHGAEHATINCFEAGEPVTPENVLRFSTLHPRCGTSFLLTVIVVKLVVNCFLGWPVLWLRFALRLAVLPLVAALAYEAIYFAGRHRDSLLARLLALPGMALERLTTRAFTRDQAEVAIYALSAVADGVPLPPDFPRPEPWPAPVGSQLPDGACASDAPPASALQSGEDNLPPGES